MFDLQGFPEICFVFEFEKVALNTVFDQVVAQRFERHVSLDPVEGVHQYARVFESIG